MLKKIFAAAALVCLLAGVSACAHNHSAEKAGACECKECKSGHCSADDKDGKCDGHCQNH